MPEILTYGQSGSEVRELHNQLRASGFGSFLTSEDKFDFGTMKALRQFQSRFRFQEVQERKPQAGRPVWVSSTPLFETINPPVSVPIKRIPSGYYTFDGYNAVTGRSKIKNADKTIEGEVPSVVVSANQPFAGKDTWRVLRGLLKSDPSGQYDAIKKLTDGISPSSVLCHTNSITGQTLGVLKGLLNLDATGMSSIKMSPSEAIQSLISGANPVDILGRAYSLAGQPMNVLRELSKMDPLLQSDSIKKLIKGANPAAILGSTYSMMGQLMDLPGVSLMTNQVRGFIQDTFSSIGMITNWISDILGTPYDLITTEDLYIINLSVRNSSGLVVAIPIVPESVRQTGNVTWESDMPMGRTAGFHGYKSTEDKSVSFSIDLYAMDFESEEHFISSCNALQSLTYPNYENGSVIPPACYVNLPGQIKFIGYCTGNDPSYDGLLTEGGHYSHVEFSMSFQAVSGVPFSATDVVDKGVFNVTNEVDSIRNRTVLSFSDSEQSIGV